MPESSVGRKFIVDLVDGIEILMSIEVAVVSDENGVVTIQGTHKDETGNITVAIRMEGDK